MTDTAPADQMDAALTSKAYEIVALLERSWPRQWSRPRLSPELRRNLIRLGTAIDDIRRPDRPNDDEGIEKWARLCHTIAGLDLARANADSLGMQLEAIDVAMTEVGSPRWLETEIRFEASRAARGVDGEWSALWGSNPLAPFERTPVATGELKRARAKLAMWYGVRQRDYTLERSRTATRARRIWALAPTTVVLALVVVLFATHARTHTLSQGLLAASSGALGATLSFAFQIKDSPPRLRELRVFGAGVALQVAIGAATGAFVWLVLRSGLIEFGTTTNKWALSAVVAFAAGFSQPFFLNIVQRLTGLDPSDQRDKNDSQQAPADSTE
jgi:hypothetical protein